MISVEEKHHEDADSIWDYFSGERKQSGSDPRVIYRGHADAGWELLPTMVGRRENISGLYRPNNVGIHNVDAFDLQL